MNDTGATDDFAAALRSVKVRAGLNLRDWARVCYLSRASLHRYCRGQAVPSDYVVVQRLAEAASASKEETVTLHHLWVVARRHVEGTAPIATGSAGPVTLPAAPAGFRARTAELCRLTELADRTPVRESSMAVITGMAGIGKTALATHWAARQVGAFSGGALYVTMCGDHDHGTPARVRAFQHLLLAFGVSRNAMPEVEEDAAATLRQLTADKRVLIVIDNVQSIDDARRLAGCFTAGLIVITSRHTLAGLTASHNAMPLPLPALDPEQSVEVITALTGPQRLEADPGGVQRLVAHCAGLPLALRIIAADLVHHPQRTIAEQNRLLDMHRLTALENFGDSQHSVRAAFDVSYHLQDGPARRLFRLLAVIPGEDFTATAAAALAGQPLGVADDLLHRLTDAHLVESGCPGRYRLHDLAKSYAADLSATEDAPATRGEAFQNLLDWYLAIAHQASSVLCPEQTELAIRATGRSPITSSSADREQALAQLDTERHNLIAAATRPAGETQPTTAWHLALLLRGYLLGRGTFAEGIAVFSAAARQARPIAAQAFAALCLADVHRVHARYDAAEDHYRVALRRCDEIDWPQLRAACIANLGAVLLGRGRPGDASACFAEELELVRHIGYAAGTIAAAVNLAGCLHQLGHLAQALELFLHTHKLARQQRSPVNEATAMYSAGYTALDLGLTDQAHDCLTSALATYQQLGRDTDTVHTIALLAACSRDRGHLAQALKMAAKARAMLDRSSPVVSPTAAIAVESVSGTVHHRLSRHHQAIASLTKAIQLAQRHNVTYQRAENHALLAETHLAAGNFDEAAHHAAKAAQLARRNGYRVIGAQAQATQGAIAIPQGSPFALSQLQAAHNIFLQTGYRRGLALTSPRIDLVHKAVPALVTPHGTV
ncbi:NTPase [Rhizocola hellebori]|uniref:NTPase n=1 Tax=Rhizocola hellebori TaxID=1392758 RepID=A0A8J3QF92_9ACTN|nr:tetratricopeptide repeat protein [Rhizocola hellebori]GIH08196.1 NTPase [Rhizocola hellebori]